MMTGITARGAAPTSPSPSEEIIALAGGTTKR
jgi:hypothetical protein